MTLREWIEAQNITQREAAKRLGVHEITVNRHVSGKQIPRRELMAAIERITEGAVKPADFFAEAAQ